MLCNFRGDPVGRPFLLLTPSVPLDRGDFYIRTLRPSATSLVKGGNNPAFEAPLLGEEGNGTAKFPFMNEGVASQSDGGVVERRWHGEVTRLGRSPKGVSKCNSLPSVLNDGTGSGAMAGNLHF